MADPMMPAEAPEEEASEQFSVTITSNGDGTYTVSSSDSDESQDDPSGQSSGQQTAQSVEEACEMAGQMLQEEQGEDSEDGNAPIPAEQQKAVWDQLAKQRAKG